MYVGFVESEPGVKVRFVLMPGGGSPVFVVHGLGESLEGWVWLGRLLAEKGFDVVLVDLRGHGSSSRSLPKPPSLDDYARDILAVADELGYSEGVGGVGFSLGGYSLLKAEDLRPGFLTRLALISSAHRVGDREGIVERARLAREGRLGELALRIARALSIPLSRAEAIARSLDPSIYAPTAESLALEDLSTPLARVASRGGVVVVAGERDGLLGAKVLEEAKGLGARVIVVEGASHFLEGRGRLVVAREVLRLLSG